MSIKVITQYGYDAIAGEYYDREAHPNSAALTDASDCLLRKQIGASEYGDGAILDVGSGRSVMARLKDEMRTGFVKRLVLLDASRAMLAQNEDGIGWRVCGDARRMPFGPESFYTIVAGLGDPYNEQSFWDEAYRVLLPGGAILFSTPSYDWATWFRARELTEKPNAARFVLNDGCEVFLPSLVLSESKQLEMVRRAGLQMDAIEQAFGCVWEKAPKVSGFEGAIVTLYAARKPSGTEPLRGRTSASTGPHGLVG